MQWLNYHHLYYFFVVAREGGLSAASRTLRVSHPTLSRQVRQLEEALDARLLERRGRTLELTPAGHRVYAYAHEIFHLGQEMLRETSGKEAAPGRRRLTVGVTVAMPKLITRQLLRPALEWEEPLELRVVEEGHGALMERLALRELDLLLADAPVPPGSKVNAHHHRLGDSELSFFAAPELRASLRPDFPGCLDGAPLLAPSSGTSVRRTVEPWLERLELRPRWIAEADDLALIKSIGQEGYGVFFAPAIISAHVVATYGVVELGRVEELRETFYAITMRRQIDDEVVNRILQRAAVELRRIA
ncbi:MAG: LysR family transcriptional regulator [Myxococcota bacterium]